MFVRCFLRWRIFALSDSGGVRVEFYGRVRVERRGHKKRENDLKTAEKYRKKQRKNMCEMEFVEIPNVDDIWV